MNLVSRKKQIAWLEKEKGEQQRPLVDHCKKKTMQAFQNCAAGCTA